MSALAASSTPPSQPDVSKDNGGHLSRRVSFTSHDYGTILSDNDADMSRSCSSRSISHNSHYGYSHASITEGGDCFDVNHHRHVPEREALEGKGWVTLGKQTLGSFGIFVLFVNNIIGPGMLALPHMYQEAGWVLPTLSMIFFTAATALSASMLCKALSMIPGNANFSHHDRMEFLTAIRVLFPRRIAVIFTFLYLLSLVSMLVASILVAGQSMDSFYTNVIGRSYAIKFIPSIGIDTSSDPDGVNFSGSIVLSIGFATAMVTLPLSFLSLEGNINVQIAAMLLLFAFSTVFFAQFFTRPFYFEQLPPIGQNFSYISGTCFFTFALNMAVPSIVNEKLPSVGYNGPLRAAVLLSFVFFTLFSFFAAWTYPNLRTSNILNSLSGNGSWMVTRLTSTAFSVVAIIPGIPLYSIMLRYNLVVEGWCGTGWAIFWGIVAPWLLSFLFYALQGFSDVIQWASLFCVGFVDFTIPLAMYIMALRKFPQSYETVDGVSDEDFDANEKELILVHELHGHDENGVCIENVISDNGVLIPLELESDIPIVAEDVLPPAITKFISPRAVAIGLFAFTCAIILLSFVVDLTCLGADLGPLCTPPSDRLPPSRIPNNESDNTT